MMKFCWTLLAIVGAVPGLCQFPQFSSTAHQSISSEIKKQSFVYAVKDTNSLGLDVYSLKSDDSVNKKPCVIFVFGGAFVMGKRDDSVYNVYFNSLVEHHYIVVSVSYRLGLRGVKHVSKFKIKPFRDAVNMAVEDVYDATNFVISKADQLGIDTSAILLSGSSAGAISVLTAEFERKNEYPLSNRLPAGFQYAGLISFSGAILSFDGKLKYKNPPAPRLMFHGTADRIVPYNDIRFFNKGLFGSAAIAKVAKENNYPYYLYSEDGLGHEVAVLPMYNNMTEIFDFLEKFIEKRKSYQVNVLFKDPDQKPKMLLSSSELMERLNQ